MANAAPHYNEGVMLLLTDGTVICKTSSGGADMTGSENIGNIWDHLTPVNGSYVNGTWSTIAAMDSPRLYFSSQVLRDGRVYVCGGEYGGGGKYGEIYDPRTNTWAFTGTGGSGVGHPFPNIVSDANSEMLPNGNILQASVDESGVNWNYVYDPTANTYTRVTNCIGVDNEAVWVKLPDNSILFMDNYGSTSERYIPSLNAWFADATAPENLFDPYGFEAGAAFLLPNGKVWFIGSLPNTLYYTPSGTTSPGTWTAGPSIPFSQGAPDAAAAMLPNGHILLTLSPTPTSADLFPSPTTYYEFDYTTNTFTQVGAPMGGTSYAQGCFISNMLVLPDGNVLFCNQADDQYYVYTPGSGPLAAGQPTIAAINRVNCDTFQATGTLFNGISEGAAYGDDWQMNTNFPIVRLTDGTNIYYATTYNWNRIGVVATGSLPDTCIFQLPAGLPANTYSVTVIANGNPSAPFTINTSTVISPSGGTVNVGETISLSDPATPGTWSSASSAIASVASTGVVTGVAVGTTHITYTITAGCYSTVVVTVTPNVAGIITGTLTACSGGTTVLSDLTSGGVWSSGNISVAIVASTGVVTGVSTGTATISYTVSGVSSTVVVTIDPLPAPILGTLLVCSGGATTSLSDLTAGGTWSSSSSATAAIGSTGIVTGGTAGTATISYTKSSSCGPVSITAIVTVNTLPAVPPAITGTLTVCAGGATISLTDATSGGRWSSISSAVGTIGSSSGIVTGIAAGTTIISYTLTNNCGSVATTKVVTVNALPGIINGTKEIYGVAATTSLSDATGGGTWSSASTSVATIASTGVVTGVFVGTSVISYTTATGCAATAIVTVDIVPSYVPTSCLLAWYAFNNSPENSFAATDEGTPYGGVTYGTDRFGNPHSCYVGNGASAIDIPVNDFPSGNASRSVSAWFKLPVPYPASANMEMFATGNNSTPGTRFGLDVDNSPFINYGWETVGYAKYGVLPSDSAWHHFVVTYPTSATGSSSIKLYFDGLLVTTYSVIGTVTILSTPTGPIHSIGTLFMPLYEGTWLYSWIGSLDDIGIWNCELTPCQVWQLYTSSEGIASAGVVIYGPKNVCTGQTITLTDGITGGTWSSSNTSVATVGSSSGVVTGITSGTTTISYTITNYCGSASTSTVVTVNPAPPTGTITGIAGLCVGTTTNLTDAVSGGTWSSGSSGIASVGSTGIVTGVTVGTAIISYSTTNTYCTASATDIATVNPISVASITGTATVCVGATRALTDATSGGVWSSGATGIATVGSSTGIVTGVSSGTVIISYIVTNICGTFSTSVVVTVNPLAIAGTVSGTPTLCVGATTNLTDATGGGVWSSGSTGVATVASGVVTGVSGGTATISYTATNSCGSVSAIEVVTVTATSAGTINGASSVCAGATIALSDATTGGVWSSGSTGIATIGSTGIVSGVSGGTAVISYTLTNSCGTFTATKTITVNPLPVAGTITGTPTLCVGTTTNLTDAAGGGTWSSSSTGVATVASTGVVTGVSAGTSIISYTVTNSCGTVRATLVVTVTLNSAGVINGATSVCPGASISLTDATAGGVWISGSTGVATVGSTGLVTGVSAGTSIISYVVATGCGTVTATHVVTVAALPDAGSISGTPVVCISLTTSLSDIAAGGVWSSAATGIATVSSTGVVTGVATGTATISYTVTNSCGIAAATQAVTVSPLASAGSIIGVIIVCNTAATQLSDLAGGGTWSSSVASVATVSSTGLVSGVSGGTTLISYTVTNSCGTVAATQILTVDVAPVAGTITGTPVVCAGATTQLSDVAPGGVWSSTTTGVATVNSTGSVTAVSVGTSTISYAVSNSCGTAFATMIVTVNPLPAAGSILGSSVVCTGVTIVLSDAAGGGVWSGSPSGIASIGSSGFITGISSGTVLISYTVTNSCGVAFATHVVTVNTSPNPGSISGIATVCAFSTTSLTDLSIGGVWSSSTTGVATVNSAGGVTGISPGTTTISYTVTNSCGIAAASKIVTVDPATSPGIINGAAVVCGTASSQLSDLAGGGVWSSSAPGIATIGSAGLVTGVSSGTTIISYTITNSCGLAAATQIFTVNILPDAGTISGAGIVCAGSAIPLSDLASGGVWSSSATSTATVGSAGLLAGVSSGTSTISYVVTNSCGIAITTKVITVDPLPAVGSISGTAVLCEPSSVLLSDVVTGGTWSSGSGGVATVGTDGTVTGVAAGTAIITYSVTNNCGTNIATMVVTINPLPQAGTITGTVLLCQLSSTTLTDASPGGIWSSSNTAVASIGSSGLLSGIAGGTAMISYSVTNSCGTAVATSIVTVNPQPDAGVITGADSLCIGSVIALSDLTAGGVWSTDVAGVATVGTAGNVTGISAGVATISYTVTNDCGSVRATMAVTVNPAPDAGVITGNLTLCSGQTTSLSDIVSGGLWSSNNTGTATVSSAGIVSGVTAGTAIISYAVTNSCGTTPVVATVTVNPLPDAGVITGPHHVCIGQIIQLADTASGMWGIDNAGIATISVSGVVNGLQPGVDTVSYSVTDGNGCSASAHFVVTVNPLPFIGPIYGADPVCIGAQVPLTDVASGGTWSSSNTSLASVGSSSGSVNAIAPGTVTITYTLPADANGCTNDTVFMLTITTVPDFTISGTVTNVNCYGGSDGSIVVAVNGGNGPFKYLWSTGDSSAQLVNIVPATYSIQVKDINTQCVLSDSFAINQPDSLNVVATITGDHCKGGNGEIVLVVSGGTAPYQYLWSNNVTTPQLAGLLAGNYTVVVSDVKNCSKTEQLQVADGTCDDLVVHNGISPNGDGENDTWIIDGIQNYRNNVVQIFDKWGDMVYEQNGYNNTWAGKASNGSELPSGTYIYVLKLNARNQSGGKDQMSGTLLLKR